MHESLPDWQLDESLSHAHQPIVLPTRWRRMPGRMGGYARKDGLRVLSSVVKAPGAGAWLHVSASRRDRLPSWGELKSVKSIFVGQHRQSLIVLPPTERWVNMHPYAMHLWTRLDADDGLPDFRVQTPDGPQI